MYVVFKILLSSNPTYIKIVLTTLSEIRSQVSTKEGEIEVVCTVPFRLGVPIRSTLATALDMIQAAYKEIFLVGYVFTEGVKELIAELASAQANRGVHVTLVGNQMHSQMPIIRSMWPLDDPLPNIFTRAVDPADNMAALHAKLLVCDGSSALITSANFSYHGLHENIEIGVKIQSPSVIRIVEFIEAMIRMNEVKVLD